MVRIHTRIIDSVCDCVRITHGISLVGHNRDNTYIMFYTELLAGSGPGRGSTLSTRVANMVLLAWFYLHMGLAGNFYVFFCGQPHISEAVKSLNDIFL